MTMYSGAVDCRKIAWAEVVSFVEVTNKISVAAYTAPMASVGHDQVMRPRIQSSSAAAAMPDRMEATCIPEKAAILMAAPPVEKSTAAAMACNRGLLTLNLESPCSMGSDPFRLFAR